MAVNSSDSIRWYNVGVFGQAGFAAPHFGNDATTLNPTILELTDLIGRNLFAFMRNEDADLRTPPSLNTLLKIHQLYIRGGKLLEGRAIPANVELFLSGHNSPAVETFRVYPCPYFLVRNAFMKSVCQYSLMLLSDCFQHSENRRQIEITERFSAMVGQYLVRIYSRMAIDLFGKTATECRVPGFVLKDSDFASYAPGKWFTSTEMIDTVPRFDRVFTEDQLEVLSDGIPATQLPALGPWPGGVELGNETDVTPATGSLAGETAGPVFPNARQT